MVKFSVKTCGLAPWTRFENWGWPFFLALPICVILLTFLVICDRSFLDSAMVVLDERFIPLFSTNSSISGTTAAAARETLPSPSPGCDIFDGTWVYDESRLLYDSCPFAEEDFLCHRNGRPDRSYQKWRWQPRECSIPKFSAKDMLTRLRGLRVVIVGDSMGRTQWESLTCLLLTGVRDKSSVEMVDFPITKLKHHVGVEFTSHDVTVDYYRSQFLVQQGKSKPKRSPSRVHTTIKLKQIDSSVAEYLTGADVLVVNTGHWWTHQKTYDIGCYFQVEDKLMLGMSVIDAYKMAVKTVTTWMNSHVDFNKTEVFFRSFEPPHWEQKMASLPYKHMAKFEDYPRARILGNAVEKNMAGRALPGLILNVTALSSNRPDGHVFNWTGFADVLDCAHWCLPGVPDTWNELLYASLLMRGRGVWSGGGAVSAR